jgi:hypothetical protein
VVAERDARAWGLRVEGLTYAAIGAQLGVSETTAFDAVRRHAAALPEESKYEANRLIHGLLVELQRILTGVLSRPHYLTTPGGRIVTGPDGEPLLDDGPAIAAVGASLRLVSERAKLLGLYPPRQEPVTVITEEIIEAEIARLQAEIL